jgi:chromosomal replication initiator protein
MNGSTLDDVLGNLRLCAAAAVKPTPYALRLLSMKTTEQKIASIKKSVALAYDLDPRDLDSLKKPGRLAEARAVAFYHCRELLKLSFPVLAAAFKRKDHMSAMWNCSSVRERMETDANFRSTVEGLAAKVAPQLQLTNA